MRFIPAFFCIALVLQSCNNTSPEELMQIDREFSDRSSQKGMKQAFLEFAADSAVILRKNSMPLVGIEAIEKSFEEFSDTGFILTWEPLAGEISKSGDLGYTYGIYTMADKANNATLSGKYVSIWKKQTDGSWKWILDAGNEGI